MVEDTPKIPILKKKMMGEKILKELSSPLASFSKNKQNIGHTIRLSKLQNKSSSTAFNTNFKIMMKLFLSSLFLAAGTAQAFAPSSVPSRPISRVGMMPMGTLQCTVGGLVLFG